MIRTYCGENFNASTGCLAGGNSPGAGPAPVVLHAPTSEFKLELQRRKEPRSGGAA